jgi:transglutaminase-like putative cysteine protease
MNLSVVHRTVLAYDDLIADTSMEMRLRPRDESGQRCLGYDLRVEPRGPVRSYRDAFGNQVEVYNHRAPHRRVVVEARSVVLTSPPLAARESSISEGERYRLLRFDGPVVDSPALRALSAELAAPGVVATPDLLTDLAALVHGRFVYEPNVTNVASTIDDLLTFGRGVCQDFAHLWIGLCRALGIPARYVSGYIWNGDERQEQASHAWGEAWVPGQGWLAYDPTNYTPEGQGRAVEQHVRVAIGRDYRDVPPTRGVFRGAARETLSVDVRVTRVTSEELPQARRA